MNIVHQSSGDFKDSDSSCHSNNKHKWTKWNNKMVNNTAQDKYSDSHQSVTTEEASWLRGGTSSLIYKLVQLPHT